MTRRRPPRPPGGGAAPTQTRRRLHRRRAPHRRRSHQCLRPNSARAQPPLCSLSFATLRVCTGAGECAVSKQRAQLTCRPAGLQVPHVDGVVGAARGHPAAVVRHGHVAPPAPHGAVRAWLRAPQRATAPPDDPAKQSKLRVRRVALALRRLHASGVATRGDVCDATTATTAGPQTVRVWQGHRQCVFGRATDSACLAGPQTVHVWQGHRQCMFGRATGSACLGRGGGQAVGLKAVRRVKPHKGSDERLTVKRGARSVVVTACMRKSHSATVPSLEAASSRLSVRVGARQITCGQQQRQHQQKQVRHAQAHESLRRAPLCSVPQARGDRRQTHRSCSPTGGRRCCRRPECGCPST